MTAEDHQRTVTRLTDEVRARLVSQVMAAIAAVRDNEASQQRKPYLLSPIMIPTESNAGP